MARPKAGKKNPPGKPSRGPDGRVAVFADRTADYAAVLAAPFSNPNAHVPIAPTVPSALRSYKASTTMTVGTAGVGFVVANPFLGCASDGPAAIYSNVAYAGTTIAPGAAGTTALYTNAGVAVASWTFSKARVVAAGLRIVPTGPNMDINGTIVKICCPGGDSISGMTQAILTGYDGVINTRITTGTQSVVWAPCMPDDYNWYVPTTTFTDFAPCMGVLVTATAGDTFLVEIVMHYEVVGQYSGGATRVMPDTEAAFAITAAATERNTGGQNGSGMSVSGVLSAASQAITDVSHAIGTVASLAGPAYSGVAGVATAIGNASSAYRVYSKGRDTPAQRRLINRRQRQLDNTAYFDRQAREEKEHGDFSPSGWYEDL